MDDIINVPEFDYNNFDDGYLKMFLASEKGPTFGVVVKVKCHG